MTKTLLMIAGASFVLCAVCFGVGAAVGGHEFWQHGWAFHNAHIKIDDDGVNVSDNADEGPVVTRQLVWNGADALDIQAPGTVQFTQAPGPAKVTVTGPKGAVDHITFQGSRLQYDDDDFDGGRVNVVMSAPGVRRFTISGDDSLDVAGYDQADLDVSVSGDGQVTVKGKTKSAKLDIAGDGDVDFSGLTAGSANADISGSGHASLAPTDAADLRISGSGEIDLLTRPAQLNTDVTGSGRIVQGTAVTTQKAS
ncbi:MAG TPA: DUF2807 domain-containing protein [Caulobacteraceae bacterium]|jgi:hypothetical protein